MPSAPAIASVDLSVLREMLRHYQAFCALYEAERVDTLTAPDGTEWCLWDLKMLVERGLPLLPERQREAIYWCFLENKRERDAAVAMRVASTNPVSMYANHGLAKLIGFIEDGTLPMYFGD